MTEQGHIPQLDLFHSRKTRVQSVNDHIHLKSDQIRSAYGQTTTY